MRSMTVLLASLTLLAPVALAETAEAPGLSGTWLLNEPQSETLREVMREAMVAQSDNPRMRERMERAAMRERASLRVGAFSKLVVEASEEVVSVRYNNGQTRELYTDGRELPAFEGYGIRASTAGWVNGLLVVENESMRGNRVETWTPSDNGQRLFVVTEVDGGERYGEISFRRIYDREPEAPTGPTVEESPDGDDSAGDGAP